MFHDANYDDVKRAIDEAVAIFPTLTDCGKLSVEPTLFQDNGQTVTWAGMRLLRNAAVTSAITLYESNTCRYRRHELPERRDHLGEASARRPGRIIPATT